MAKSLLLADDSATFHRVITQILGQDDLTVTAVRTGDEAIAKAISLRPDAVLADTFMPGGKNGYDIAAALRANPATSHIPVLLLASPNEPFDEAKARASGAVGQLPKPFQSQALIDQVRNLLSGARPAPAASVAPAPRPTAPAPAAAPAPAPAAPAAKTAAPPPRPPGPPPAPGAAPVAKTAAPPPRPPGPPPAPGAAPVAKTAAPPPRPPGAPVPGAAPAKAPPPPAGAAPVAKTAAPPPRPPAIPGAPTQPAPARPAGVAPPAGAVAKGPPPAGTVAKGPPPAAAPVAKAAAPAQQLTAANHEALLREALSKATKEMIEKVIWEVVPELAETMIKEELAKLVKARGG